MKGRRRRILSACLHPRLVALTASVSNLLGSILVAEGTDAGCHMTLEAQILEERWQLRGIQRQRAAEHTPQIQDVTRRCLEEVQVRWREVDVINIAVLNVIHVLIVRDAQGQNAAHHGLSVHNVTIEQHGWVRNLHLLVFWINVVDTGVDRLREVADSARPSRSFLWAAPRQREQPLRDSHSQLWAFSMTPDERETSQNFISLLASKTRRPDRRCSRPAWVRPVTEGTAAGCHMTLEAQILEERWQLHGFNSRQRVAEHTPQIQAVTRRSLE